MPFTIRRIDPDRNFLDHITWDIFATTIPVTAVDAALTATAAHEQRQRRLSMRVIVFLVIAMNIWTQCAIPMVFRHMVRGLRWIWPTDERLPQSNALTYRRYQLGVKPLAWLFRHQCRPLATAATRSAFLCGLRLMALDGTVENVPDTPANARYFGRPRGARGDGAVPQARLVYLLECGTHAIVDAGIWPCTTHERIGGSRMLRSVAPGMLVLWDRGFHSYAMLAATIARGAHVLTRLSAATKPVVVETLADGSQLVAIIPHHRDRGADPAPRLVLRRIAYHLSLPALGDPTTTHYLLTSLLDPAEAPARTLVCAYHERWEVEITIDELDTHQRVVYRPFRSQKPVGVIQEFYGSLLAHYAIRAVMHDAAVAAEIDPERISFVVAAEEIRAAVREFQQTDPADHPTLYRRLLAECTRTLLPRRRLRIYPRVIKQKVSRFFRKRPEDQGWCDSSGQFATAVCVVGADGAAWPNQAALPPIQWTHKP